VTSCWFHPVYVLEQYEALRQEALGADPLGRRGHGLALFLSRGMTAWMVTLSALGSPPPASPGAEPAGTREMPKGPSFPRSDLTRVLADMVLTCTQENVR
jgi:hypothetical protein